MDKMGNPEIIREFFQHVLVRDVMSSPVHTVLVDDQLSKASEMFGTYNVIHIPVVDKNDKLVGLLSHKYLYKTQSPRRFLDGEITPVPGMVVEGDTYFWRDHLDSYILKRIMNPNPFTMGPDQPLSEAITHMANRRVGCITVIDKHRKVVGILSDLEIVKFVATLML